MATTKFYLDSRVSNGKPAPLKIAITHKSRTALIHLNISLLSSQWDDTAGKIVGLPNKQFLNAHITKIKMKVDEALLTIAESGRGKNLTATELKHLVGKIVNGDGTLHESFASRFLAFSESKNPGTKSVYMQTYRRMAAFDRNLDNLSFDDIDKSWLTSFDRFMAETAPSANARNIHLRNIRAVFNDAIDDGITNNYPFRKFKIRPVATAKRSLTVDQLRTLFSAPAENFAEKYLDMFKLIFYLIGINSVDLYRLEAITSDGRIEYNRAKTGRLYSIKVEL